MPAAATSRNGSGSSATGRPAYSRPPHHTVATWTACREGQAVYYVLRWRWRHQPRPTPTLPDQEVPQTFCGHTLPTAVRLLRLQGTCWLCGVPILHLATHEAGQLHTDLLGTLSLPANVVASVLLLQRDRPTLLSPPSLHRPPLWQPPWLFPLSQPPSLHRPPPAASATSATTPALFPAPPSDQCTSEEDDIKADKEELPSKAREDLNI